VTTSDLATSTYNDTAPVYNNGMASSMSDTTAQTTTTTDTTTTHRRMRKD
jgi:hypothetical protein